MFWSIEILKSIVHKFPHILHREEPSLADIITIDGVEEKTAVKFLKGLAIFKKFMAEHPFLSREDALRILKMEPEDRVLEITRLQVLNNRTKNAHGGLAKILEV